MLPPAIVRAIATLAPGLMTATLAACSGSTASMSGSPGDGGQEAGITQDQATRDAANAYCTRAQSCAPAYVTLEFGDVATCETQLTKQLAGAFAAPGTSSTPAQTEACAQAIPNTSCEDLLARKSPMRCVTLPGTLADGTACGTDSQCKGTRCKVASTATCGTCTSPVAAGAACGVDGDCQPGLTCVNLVCVAYGNEGAACSMTAPCRPDLGCVSGTCGTPSPLGAACADSTACAQIQGDFCNPVSQQCESVSFSTPNGACGLVAKRLVLCQGPGGTCQGIMAPSYQGTCEGYAADGAACNVDGGPGCNAGSVCAGGSCTAPDFASCK